MAGGVTFTVQRLQNGPGAMAYQKLTDDLEGRYGF